MAERDIQLSETQPLNMERYLGTITSLLDLFAVPGRGGSRQTRTKILTHCTQLVDDMIQALQRGPMASLGHVSLVGKQARDIISWLQASRARLSAPDGSKRRGSFGSVGSGDGESTMADELGLASARHVARLALFLHTWQVAMAHEVLAAAMPLDALRELLHLPCDEESSRDTQFAPKAATLLNAFSCPSPAFASPRRFSSRSEATAGGQVSFLPSWYHSVNAEMAVQQVESMMASARTANGASAATHIVSDAIILALQCLLSLKKQRAHTGGMLNSASGYFSDASSSLCKRRRQTADGEDTVMLQSPTARRCLTQGQTPTRLLGSSLSVAASATLHTSSSIDSGVIYSSAMTRVLRCRPFGAARMSFSCPLWRGCCLFALMSSSRPNCALAAPHPPRISLYVHQLLYSRRRLANSYPDLPESDSDLNKNPDPRFAIPYRMSKLLTSLTGLSIPSCRVCFPRFRIFFEAGTTACAPSLYRMAHRGMCFWCCGVPCIIKMGG